MLSHAGGWLQVMHESDVGYIADRSNYIKLYTIHSVRDGKQTDLDIAAAKAEEIKRKVRQQTEEVSRYNQREKKIIDQLQKTDLALGKVRKQIAAIESDLAAVVANISGVQKKVDQAREIIGKNKRIRS